MLNQLDKFFAALLTAGVFVAAPVAVRAEMEGDIEYDRMEMESEMDNRNLSADATEMEMEMGDRDMDSREMGDDMESLQMRQSSMEMDDDMDMGRESEFSSTPVRGLW